MVGSPGNEPQTLGYLGAFQKPPYQHNKTAFSLSTLKMLSSRSYEIKILNKKYESVATHTCLDRKLNPKSGYVPDWEPKL